MQAVTGSGSNLGVKSVFVTQQQIKLETGPEEQWKLFIKEDGQLKTQKGNGQMYHTSA